ncbi:murein L,D-transpeptidase catalytic domain family protein [Flavitalea sp. BT771]|uniref:murein L,D-transpeptidase catalytic domain family protein n=1 Tax=Flavitalea sp. BT771 TaxID=3063329 RepID=UPI0026E3ABFA|nr:murein L,D-transpeptidase catalytic domain family protein [Flavitalea sp. BT771]MDO6434545.1 murein L,D-transpeptidase catalytic domain family protein [Flavitalea sp. BT771]MDV6223445.1 murein L,D-transpeptidase catalytic domain family protein [Flavitalea sp. BT771]
MKYKVFTNPSKILLMLFILTAPAVLVAGENEISTRTFGDYHSADLIRKFIHYKVSAEAVCARAAELAKAEAARAEAEVAKAAASRRVMRMAAMKAEYKIVMNTALGMYDMMDLENEDLSLKAFEYAWLGYHHLLKQGKLQKTDLLTICDFSQSSSKERMYVIDVRNKKILYKTFVAHGINSGEEYASSFSNQEESCKSSLGFYVTRKTYQGVNGLSLRIEGLDKGFNDNAYKRSIVIHGAPYVSLRILHKYGVMGTTFGCPAIPSEVSDEIIPLVKNGSCFFIYYPSKKYLSQSTVLNNF